MTDFLNKEEVYQALYDNWYSAENAENSFLYKYLKSRKDENAQRLTGNVDEWKTFIDMIRKSPETVPDLFVMDSRESFLQEMKKHMDDLYGAVLRDKYTILKIISICYEEAVITPAEYLMLFSAMLLKESKLGCLKKKMRNLIQEIQSGEMTSDEAVRVMYQPEAKLEDESLYKTYEYNILKKCGLDYIHNHTKRGKDPDRKASSMKSRKNPGASSEQEYTDKVSMMLEFEAYLRGHANNQSSLKEAVALKSEAKATSWENEEYQNICRDFYRYTYSHTDKELFERILIPVFNDEATGTLMLIVGRKRLLEYSKYVDDCLIDFYEDYSIEKLEDDKRISRYNTVLCILRLDDGSEIDEENDEESDGNYLKWDDIYSRTANHGIFASGLSTWVSNITIEGFTDFDTAVKRFRYITERMLQQRNIGNVGFYPEINFDVSDAICRKLSTDFSIFAKYFFYKNRDVMQYTKTELETEKAYKANEAAAIRAMEAAEEEAYTDNRGDASSYNPAISRENMKKLMEERSRTINRKKNS